MHTSSPAISIMKGTTTHSRFEPFRRAFTYPVTMIDVDIARLSEADRVSRWFSINRFNLLSFFSKDRGDRGEIDLENWARERFEAAGLSVRGKVIRVMTFPRTLGFSFAPISIWKLLDTSGKLSGMIYEVNNTFGDDHAYVAPVEASTHRHAAPKNFHVSPFMDVSGQYRFTLQEKPDQFDLLIENIVDNQRVHAATLSLGSYAPSPQLVRQTALNSLLAGFGVVARIHWQALKLWLRGARYHSRNRKTKNEFTLAFPSAQPETLVSEKSS
ncbi:MAG: hypothetical protein CMK09_13105 [Ponticaulis sp.]|nr:hypothetical protein [Ponticaulis sp.]|tara:strand:- start:39749 stop:40561 length:813 start_codon:yes stop_codon:yes gene_type:complete